MSSEELSWVGSLSQKMGWEEITLRYLLGVVIANVAAFVYNLTWLKRSPFETQNVYFIITGMFISYWTFGIQCVGHHLTCILVNYVVLKLFGGSLYTASFLFLFQFGYLCVGYLMNNMTAEYALNWTMPHCVLCLKLIGLAIDVYDGSKHCHDNKEFLKNVPGLLEMIGHAFFPTTYSVGPQHSMMKYRNFIRRNVVGGLMMGSKLYAFQRFLFAVLFMVLHVTLTNTVSTDYITSEEFQELPYLKMNCYLAISFYGYILRYISLWLLAEVGSILTGFSYVGTKSNATLDWSGGANVDIRLWITSTNFRQYWKSWNIATNCISIVFQFKL